MSLRSVFPAATNGNAPKEKSGKKKTSYRSDRLRSKNSIIARGEPMLWMTGGSLLLCLFMIVGLLGLIIYNGLITFWPSPIVELKTREGEVLMGEVTRSEYFVPVDSDIAALPVDARQELKAQMDKAEGKTTRRLVRTGNFELTNEHFNWVNDYQIIPGSETYPEWAILFERVTWGRFYGIPEAFILDGKKIAQGSEAAWNKFLEFHSEVRNRWKEKRELENMDTGRVNYRLEHARLDLRQKELDFGLDSPEWKEEKVRHDKIQKEAEAEFDKIREKIENLNRENDKYQLLVKTAQDEEKMIPLAEVVRAFTPNRISWSDKMGIYFSRFWEFLSDDPREANSEGGVFPAIFGTVVMTLLMTIFVVPLGVLAALYLREYAKAGPVVSAVRIAINNLAGVPSIVFGVFGLGFFIYIIGGSFDQLFFEAALPNPTYGKGGVLWASLTLSLLTLPVVIVATEEALAAVPDSLRAGSYACGASKWQTIKRIILPRAMPGITTGTILAMARGAGEVAPLMVVGAVKLAPKLPIDSFFPFIHPERSFMHLGFHIYDLGFQSQNSEAAQSLVFTTTLILILIILALNLAAIIIRSKLRKKFLGNQF